MSDGHNVVSPPLEPGFLLLEDGTLFRGRIRAGSAPRAAEVVFTTNMTGYQEVFTDPSYDGQIVVLTAPQIGNYGINLEDPESSRPQVAGVVVRELSASSFELARHRVARRVAGRRTSPNPDRR